MKQILVRNPIALGLCLMMSPIVAIGGLPTYEPISSLAGEFSIDGSDTVGKAAEVWVEEFKTLYPDVSITLTQQGSGDGAKAVLNSTADIGNMSRKMKPKEMKAFSDAFGYKPTELRVGIDAVAVFSSKGLGVDQLTIAQVDQVFSSSLKCGGSGLKSLADIGGTGANSTQMPELFIRDANSGTRAFFSKKGLCRGEFKAEAQEFVHTSELVAAVSKSKTGFGFGGLADLNDSVQTIAIAKKTGQDAHLPTADNAASGQYPLSRYLFMYINKTPGKALKPEVAEFVKFAVSEQGQAILTQVGYVALPEKPAQRTLKALD